MNENYCNKEQIVEKHNIDKYIQNQQNDNNLNNYNTNDQENTQHSIKINEEIAQNQNENQSNQNKDKYNYNMKVHNLEVSEDSNVLSISETQIRRDFIAKVYGIFLMQIVTTVIISSTGFIPTIKVHYQNINQNQNNWVLWLYVCLTFLTMMPLICFKNLAKKVPYNYILLFSFTIFEALTLSYIYAIIDNWKIVLTAALMTVTVTIALTTYACFTKTDFTAMRGILLVCIVLLILLGICSIWVGFLRSLYCFLAVGLFSIYIVMDTQMILGKFKLEYGVDDYIIAALNIYVDVINLFSNLLSILGN
jgi:FtsH-binding integral membrane protein